MVVMSIAGATSAIALAIGVLVGGLGQLLVQLPELRRIGVPVTVNFP